MNENDVGISLIILTSYFSETTHLIENYGLEKLFKELGYIFNSKRIEYHIEDLRTPDEIINEEETETLFFKVE